MNQQILSISEIQNGLDQLNQNTDQEWTVIGGKLHKIFQFKNFIEAFGFMTRAAIVAEKLNHHPDWSNVYRTVTVNLVTHEANGITALDFKLAKKMDGLI